MAGIEPVQFALAGMNAHINHDLPVAMVSTCTALSTAPAPHFADYQKVDQLLDAAEQSVRQSLESAAELAVDRHVAAVANLVTSWTITSARDLAWNNTLLLWAVRDDPITRGLFLDTLATSTVLASKMPLRQSETARPARPLPPAATAHRPGPFLTVAPSADERTDQCGRRIVPAARLRSRHTSSYPVFKDARHRTIANGFRGAATRNRRSAARLSQSGSTFAVGRINGSR